MSENDIGLTLVSVSWIVIILALELRAAMSGFSRRKVVGMFAVGVIILLVAIFGMKKEAQEATFGAAASVALVGAYMWFDRLIKEKERNRRCAYRCIIAFVLIALAILGAGVYFVWYG